MTGWKGFTDKMQVNEPEWQKDDRNKRTIEGRDKKKKMERKEEPTIKLLRFQGRRWTYFHKARLHHWQIH